MSKGPVAGGAQQRHRLGVLARKSKGEHGGVRWARERGAGYTGLVILV